MAAPEVKPPCVEKNNRTVRHQSNAEHMTGIIIRHDRRNRVSTQEEPLAGAEPTTRCSTLSLEQRHVSGCCHAGLWSCAGACMIPLVWEQSHPHPPL
jgi:hypothetical protein